MRIPAVLSMLHEPANRGSADRQFRGRPVLAWTLDRLSAARNIQETVVLCWDDQAEAAAKIAATHHGKVVAKGARSPLIEVDSVTIARRWSDGWRGGLLQTCEFDRGFHGPSLIEIAAKSDAGQLLLIDPAAGLVDAELVDGLIAHAEANPTVPLVFSPAAPGLSGLVIQADLIRQIASAKTFPGRFIHYQPQSPAHDPLSGKNCAPVPAPIARSLYRYTLDTIRQIQWLEAATAHLNGELMSTPALGLVNAVAGSPNCDTALSLPREVNLELTTRRATRPVFLPAGHLPLDRPDLSIETARCIFSQLSAADDIRLTFGGAGDALLSSHFFELLDAAHQAGVRAVHARTDLLDVTPETLERIAQSDLDVLSVHIPATSATVYQQLMGVDGLARVVEHVRALVNHRFVLGRPGPILVPIFTKCRQNLVEMEIWYDRWLAALGSAAIAGANDFAGQIPDQSVADMQPPARVACRWLGSKMHILSDGRVVACEQDVLGRSSLGDVKETSIADLWRNQFGALRADHADGQWSRHSLCAACREWHRP